jgi:GATA-binding protein
MTPASNATAPAIPIRKPNHSTDPSLSLARASAPSVPPTVVREHEFGYVQRHVRKTSIDERRVSRFVLPALSCTPNALSAPQTARRDLSSGSRCQQHHDTHRPRGGGGATFLLTRSADAHSGLPPHPAPGALCY